MRFGWGVLAMLAAVGTAAPATAAPAKPSVAGLSGYTVATSAVPMSLGDMGPSPENAAMATDGNHVAYTEAATETGRRSRALASPVWSANAGTSISRQLEVPGTNSLVAMRASHPGGPDRAGTKLPGGPEVSAAADGQSAVAHAATSAANVSGLVIAEELSGLSQSSMDDGVVIGRGVATVGKVQALAGLVSLEGVITRVKVTSNGVKAVVEGNTTVNRVVVAGVPVSFTAGGFADLPEVVEKRLTRMGITLRLIQPADTIDGASGSRSVGGVLLRYDSKIGRSFLEKRRADDWALGSMPERWEQAAVDLLALGGDVTVRFGQVAVRAAASTAGPVAAGPALEPGRVLGALAAEGEDPVVTGPEFVAVDGDEVAAESPRRFLHVVGGVGVPVLLVGLALFTALAVAIPLSRLAEEAVAPAPNRRPGPRD